LRPDAGAIKRIAFAQAHGINYRFYRLILKWCSVKTGLIDHILGLSRFQKRVIALVADATLCVATVAVAYYLRVGFWLFPQGIQWLSYATALALALPIFVTFGFYRAIFRYAGWGALMAVSRATTIYGIAYASIFTAIGFDNIPRTIGIIQPMILFLAIGASRAIARYWLGGGYHRLKQYGARKRILIYGAGSAGRQLAAGLANSADMLVIGFVDDDSTLHGSVLNGKTIYTAKNLGQLIERLDISDLLLAIPSATRRRRNEILEEVRGTSASIRTLPGLMDLAHGRVTVSDLRQLDIEDLLGRDTVPPNHLLLGKNIVGKTVLVTGAGGSIGSELCRQALKMEPTVLLLIESSEYNLYAIHQELETQQALDGEPIAQIVPLLASVQDASRMTSIMATWRPDTVYHAAAYKHVPLVEHNPAEGIRNNVFGTLTTAKAAAAAAVSDFVLISTDKAVRPTNVMGTSKRLAEMVLQALATQKGQTRFSMVRFGNVLGSSGSVVPRFRDQIRNGGPVTITDTAITRYFMTIPEAAQLVIQAGAMAMGGEVFVLDMGDPVRIIDLAQRMIELSGLSVRNDASPDGDVAIEVIGLRPGEKLYEELLIGDNPSRTTHPRIMKANESMMPWATLQKELQGLERAIVQDGPQVACDWLKRLVPEYCPDGQSVDWVLNAETNTTSSDLGSGEPRAAA
jgi:FlaA1/EpsC-like NDP-sugar epimerase